MPGLIRGVASNAVVAGTASSVAGRVNRRQQQKWAEQDAQAAPAAPTAPAAAPVAPATPAADPIQQLKDLGELHKSGVLTDEEFAVQKSKILNG